MLGNSRTRSIIGVAAVLLALVSVPGTSAAAGNYTATASARLVGVDFTTVPAIAFEQLIDAGVSVAQAEIDSLGSTRAFASSPYPSGSVILLPGLIAGITGGQTSDLIPDYPLIAATNETTPSDRRELGTLVLDAASTPGSSRGTVNDGLTTATAQTTADDARVVARAETTISSIQLTDVLSLDGIHTVAEAALTPEGEIEVSSSFEVAAITILGQRIALTHEMLEGLGTEVPLGLGSVIGQLVAALASDGTQIEFVPAVATEDGITSAGLRISSVVPAPPEVASGLQELRAQVTLGLASATVSSRAFTRPGSDGAPAVVTGPVAVPNSPILGGGGPIGGALPATPVPSGSTSAAPNVSSGPAGTPASIVSPLPVDLSLASFYPVLVLAALLGTGLVNLIRHLGVRSP